ncbi:MAG: transglutaminase family protein [Pararhodobacter sp.]|nr:transglutaminase family protein [Pararhodobacter sp.]
MTKHSANLINPDLLNEFFDSTLGLYLDDNAARVFPLGRVRYLAPGEGLNDPNPYALHIILGGRMAGPHTWFGPGNHISGANDGLQAVDLPARIWTLDMGGATWAAAANRPLRRAMTHALIAADAAEAAATPPAVLPDPETLCDVDHPEIRRRAVRLRRSTQANTAEEIMKYVQTMPYRFGAWQERASDTMARGTGMCTTKANVQVALMRAAGLEAGFVEIPMPITTLGRLMPSSWLALMRPTVRHYFAAVKLGGRWHSADSSYDYEAFSVYLETMPQLQNLVPVFLGEGRPFAPAIESEGNDPFDITVVPHLNEEMGKRSRFQTRHFEALNTRLDRVRGTQRYWARVAMEQAARDNTEALA